MDSQGIEPRTFRMQSGHYTPKPQAHVDVMDAETLTHKPEMVNVNDALRSSFLSIVCLS